MGPTESKPVPFSHKTLSSEDFMETLDFCEILFACKTVEIYGKITICK